jgi:hypothetical protein
MPDFSVEDLEISPYEYVSACRGSEIRDLIIGWLMKVIFQNRF